jgi:hypothetical protein
VGHYSLQYNSSGFYAHPTQAVLSVASETKFHYVFGFFALLSFSFRVLLSSAGVSMANRSRLLLGYRWSHDSGAGRAGIFYRKQSSEASDSGYMGGADNGTIYGGKSVEWPPAGKFDARSPCCTQ